MRKRMRRTLGFLGLLFCMVLGLQVSAGAIDQVTIPAHAVRSGNYIYWAIGNDNGGSIKSYHVKTKKSKTLAKGKCRELSVKGGYIYFTLNKYAGTSSTNFYVYRVKTNGKGLKRLADGHNPVIIGNAVYYIATKKGKFFGDTADTETLGIYRMNLNGSGKTCIYQSSNREYPYDLCRAEDKLIFYSYGKPSSIDLSGNNKSYYSWSPAVQKTNTQPKSSRTKTVISANSKGAAFEADGSSVIRISKSGTRKRIRKFSGKTVQKIIDMNGYLFVVTQGQVKSPVTRQKVLGAIVYVMKSDGSKCKKLTSFPLAGGGWS